MAGAMAWPGSLCSSGGARNKKSKVRPQGNQGKFPHQGLRKEPQGERRPRSKEPFLIKNAISSPWGARWLEAGGLTGPWLSQGGLGECTRLLENEFGGLRCWSGG